MDLRALGMGLAFAVMWSSAFTSARIIVAAAPPLTALSLRFLISGLLGVLIALALGQSWRLTRGQWRATIVFGICQNALYLGLNFVAMQTIEAGLAAGELTEIVNTPAQKYERKRRGPLLRPGLIEAVDVG